MSIFDKFRLGLSKSSKNLSSGLNDLIFKKKIDESMLDELEDFLIQSDVGIEAAKELRDKFINIKLNPKTSGKDEVFKIVSNYISEILKPLEKNLENLNKNKPSVILIAGVNGVGKTTTIGKLGKIFKQDGKKVAFAAADTFRAAAVEQLKVWGQRANAEVIYKEIGTDSAALAFEALEIAKKNKADILIIDTAGRLQNKSDLMAQLEKIPRVLKKIDPTAPHSALLVLDATTGQNVHSQVDLFRKACSITGLIMTKLDGTARGGVLVSIAEKFSLPIHAIGVGEDVDDLQPFEADLFAKALLGLKGNL